MGFSGPRRMQRRHARIAAVGSLVVAAVFSMQGHGRATAAESLAASIDRIVAQAAVGPSAEVASDADFVRRIHLDLTGVIPTPERVQAFLADQRSDRRPQLIEELLNSRAFVRHMGLVLDAMLLERTSPPSGLAVPWQAWLRDAVANERPLDELLGDVVAAEGGDPTVEPAAAFLLARSAEPVKMTRAVGRILFGRDLQCAQCHDHPLDDDIRQAEFHGLHAFVKRTSLFTAGKAQQLSEAAIGEVDFTSVFTEESVKAAWPQLPDGPPLIDEPVVEPGDGYTTTPSKSSRGVPSYSRRSALAARLSESDTFRRNLVNRLWAVFFGQGLVHPLDGLGPDNAPSHPQLLAALVDALVEHDYQLRPVVRGIVSSETYQRSIDPPQADAIDTASLETTITTLKEAMTVLTAEREQHAEAAKAAERRRQEAFDRERALHEQLQPSIAARTETRTEFNTAAKAADAADAARDQAAAVAEAVEGALAQARQASELLAGDAEVTGVISSLEKQQKTRSDAQQAADTAAAEKASAKTTAEAELTAARTAFDELASQRSPETLAACTEEAEQARRRLVDCEQQLDRISWRLELADDMLRLSGFREVDVVAAEQLWDSVVTRLTENLQVARLRPLSPDQFAFSLLQATGGLARLEAAAVAAIEKKPPASVTEAVDAERDVAREKAIEAELLKQAGGVLGSFASLYADPLVEGFQATLNQALYLGNASQVSSELAPQGENLAARLIACAPAEAADQVCLAIFSRPASEAEQADVAAFLGRPTEERPQAVAELIWAMLSSTEFRFQH